MFFSSSPFSPSLALTPSLFISLPLSMSLCGCVFPCPTKNEMNPYADKNIQHKHEIQKVALHEYYEKHGGSPGHH